MGRRKKLGEEALLHIPAGLSYSTARFCVGLQCQDRAAASGCDLSQELLPLCHKNLSLGISASWASV